MKAIDYIVGKQQLWAAKNSKHLFGSRISDNGGEKNYFDNLNDNLFQPLSQSATKEYQQGDGNELVDKDNTRAKMKAIHSSSSIVVNIFDYWQDKNITPIAYVCGLCNKNNSHTKSIKFEDKYPVFPNSQTNPNLDVVVHCDTSIFAIESKFTEPYSGHGHSGIQAKYIRNNSFWQKNPNLKQLALSINPDDKKFKYLHAAQLIKHILGLQNTKKEFRLLYLWYNVLGIEGAAHQKEIEQFAEIAKKDNIKFSHITYQEIIIKLSKEFYVGNENYCNYLIDRYL